MYKQISGNKYKAKSQVYNGRSYHSGAEASYAQELDLRLKAKDIKSWEAQVKIEFNLVFGEAGVILTDTPALELKKQMRSFSHICNYYMDFVVTHNDGEVEYIEIKGVQTELWKMKWKLTEAVFNNHPTISLTVVKVGGGMRNYGGGITKYKPKK